MLQLSTLQTDESLKLLKLSNTCNLRPKAVSPWEIVAIYRTHNSVKFKFYANPSMLLMHLAQKLADSNSNFYQIKEYIT